MKVTCPGCSHSYKLDDNTIPETGQTMKCPRCATSFAVNREQPGMHSPSPPAAVLGKSMPSIDDFVGGEEFDLSAHLSDEGLEEIRKIKPAESSFERPSGAFGALDDDQDFPDVERPSISDIVDLPRDSEINRPARPVKSKKPVKTMNLPPLSESEDFLSSPGQAGRSGIKKPLHEELPEPSGFVDLEDAFGDEQGGVSLDPSHPLGKSLDDMDFGTDSLPSPADLLGGISISSAPPSSDGVDFSSIDLDAEIADTIPPAGPTRTSQATRKTDLPGPLGSLDDFGTIDVGPNPQDAANSILSMEPPPALMEEPDDFAFDAPILESLSPPSKGTSQKPNASWRGGGEQFDSSSASPGSATDTLGGLTDLEIPSPVDLLDSLPTNEDPLGSGVQRIKGSGTINFGEVDIGPGALNSAPPELAPPPAELLEEEFDAFPTQSGTEAGSGIDLAPDALDLERMGGFAPGSEDGDIKERTDEDKPAAEFAGRRKLERQSRRSKAVLLIFLLVLVAAGVAMSFTSLGPFGAYAIYKLLPQPTTQKDIEHTRDMIASFLQKDTVRGIESAINEYQVTIKENSQNEDLRLLGVYLYSWAQIRLGVQKNYDREIAKLLGAINLDESESQFAPYAKTAQYLRLERKPNLTPNLVKTLEKTANGMALLSEAYLTSGNRANAQKVALQLDKKEHSARSGYLLARTFDETKQQQQIVERLTPITKGNSEHIDAILLLAKTQLGIKPLDDNSIQDLCIRVIDQDDKKATGKQKAMAHAILAGLFYKTRLFRESESRVKLAEALDSENPLMLLYKGELALLNDDYSSAASSFNAVLMQHPNNLDAILGQTESLLNEGKLVEVKNRLTQILNTNPKSARAHYLMGKVHLALHDVEQAEKSLQKAIELDKELLEAYVTLSDLYLKTERNTDAMLALDRASEAVPNSILIRRTLAEVHAAQGDFASAIIELGKALDLDPDDVSSHFRMAQMYRKMNSLDDAKRALEEVKKRKPDYPGLAVEDGIVMELNGNRKEALKMYKKALEAKPDDLSTKLRVAATSHLVGDNETAEKLLMEILAETPESAEANFYLGEVYRVTGKSAEATTLLKTAQDLEPKNALYHVRYGMALMDTNRIADAQTLFERTIKLDPDMAETYVRMGQIRLKQGAARDAIVLLDKGLSLDPSFTETYSLIADCFEQLGDMRSALNYSRKAVAAEPENAELAFKLGLAELTVKGRRKALGPFSKAIALADKKGSPFPSWYPEALYRLGMAQRSSGNRAEAVKSFKRYLETAPKEHIDRSEVISALDELGIIHKSERTVLKDEP